MEIVIRLNEEDLKDNVVLNMVNNLFKQNKVSSTPLNKVLGKPKQVEGRIKKKIVVYDDLGCLVGTFASIYETANTLGVDRKNIYKVLNGERKSLKGYTFKQVG